MKIAKTNMVAGVLGVLLGFTFWANDQIFRTASLADFVSVASFKGRIPASEAFRGLRSGDADAERSLASVIAEPSSSKQSGRSLSSLGKDSGPLDDFRFGVLEGKYSITLGSGADEEDGDKIKNIGFVDNPGSEGRPTVVDNRLEFLKKYSELMDIKSDVEKVKTVLSGRRIIEFYRAFSRGSDLPVMVQVELDDKDRLYGITLQDSGTPPGSGERVPRGLKL